MIEELTKALERDEGLRLTLYSDSVGVPTIGYGHNLHTPISRPAAQRILSDDIDKTIGQLDRRLPWWRKLDEPRQAALANMAFNLGIAGLMGFRHMLSALQANDWGAAHDEALKSEWARQVGDRAARIARQLRTGEYQ